MVQVTCEPILCEACNSSNTTALVAGLSVRGVWIPQAEALFDIRVVDTDVQSYRNRAPVDILSTADREKAKYHQACVDRAPFTPLCLSFDGLMGREAAVLVKRMAEMVLLWCNSCSVNLLVLWQHQNIVSTGCARRTPQIVSI